MAPLRALLHAAVLAIAAVAPAAAAAGSAQPAAWLLERDGTVVSERNADQRLPVASLAKLMTTVLWLQQPERLDREIEISARAAAATGARVGLAKGARYRGRDLLGAMLVRSGNDACLALAESAASSVEAFVADMNHAAALLGLADTHFGNPCGWDAEGQYSTARDLLLLARVAMEFESIRSFVAQTEFTLRSVDGKHQHTLRNTNLLLQNLPDVRGIKTGFTSKAGKCLIVMAERDGHEAWLVLVGAPERWWTAHAMIEAALQDKTGD